MTALANRQLTTDNYTRDLKEKLSKVEVERKVLRDKLADIEYRLKGIEVALEEARAEAEGERATIVLWTSLDEMKSQQEAAKEKVVNEAVTAYIQFVAFNDETTEYFISILRLSVVEL